MSRFSLSKKTFVHVGQLYLVLMLSSFSIGHATAASLTLDPEMLSDLRAQRTDLAAKIKELDEVSKQMAVAQASRRSVMGTIRRLASESAQARSKLEKMQQFDRDNPGTITREQIRAAEDTNRSIYNQLIAEKEKKSDAEMRINSLSVDGSAKYAEFLRLQKSMERDVDRVVDSHLHGHLAVLQTKKTVTATDRVPCGDDSIPVCKERSKKAAELKATEMGSVVFVNSLTEVKNFKLSKEELRSEVQASLSNKVFTNQHVVGDAEYETTITADVEPVIGDRLREQVAEGIRFQVYDKVGGRIDFASVKNPSHFAALKEEPTPEVPAYVEPEYKPEPMQVYVPPPAPVIAPAPAPAPAPVRRLEKPIFVF